MTRIRAVSAGVLALFLAVGRADAQQGGQSHMGPGWAADSLLRWFQLEATNSPRNTGEVGMPRVLFVLRHPEAVSRAKQDSVAEGLERLALRSDVPDAARVTAVTFLAMGGGSSSGGLPLRGAPVRLARVYRQSNDLGIRSAVLMSASSVADRAAMVPLLREVATRTPDPSRLSVHDDGSDPSVQALVALSRMGDVGNAALADLARSGAVTSPHARARLQRLATPKQH